MPNSPLGRPNAEINAEVQARLDALPARALCAFCPQWQVEGTAAECRNAAASHRREAHPQLKVQKRKRAPIGKWNPGLDSDRLAGEQNAAQVAAMLQRQVA